MENKDLRIAIVPGSFDPITNGHIDIVRRAKECYDKVYLAVMINDAKEYMFTLEEREAIAKAALEAMEGVEVISSRGYLWKLAQSLGACAIVKGIRNETDRAYELKMAEYNAEHYPDAKTVLLDTTEELKDLSSTLVREMISNKDAIKAYLPERAIAKIEEILREKSSK